MRILAFLILVPIAAAIGLYLLGWTLGALGRWLNRRGR